jgi:hypothetical protein
VLDSLSFAAALVAVHLDLLEEAWRKLLSLYYHTAAWTLVASIYVTICRTRALTCRTNSLLFDCELRLAPVVEVAEGYRDPYLHVWSFSLALLSTKVSWATEEAREEVEWIATALSPSSTIFVLLDALMAILVVYLSLLLAAEDLVRLGDVYELLVCGIVSTSSS